MLAHMERVHTSGSSNPLHLLSHSDKISFHPFFSLKDSEFFCAVLLFFFRVIRCPDWLGDCENSNEVQPLVTPRNIRPEWYFLAPYAILRCTPRKLGGVVAIGLSVGGLILFFFKGGTARSVVMYRGISFMFFFRFVMLTYLGYLGVSDTRVIFRKLISITYFVRLAILFKLNFVYSRVYSCFGSYFTGSVGLGFRQKIT